MQLAHKKRIVVLVLLFLSLWPGVHFALFESYAINPWKLFGFAMYCTPRPELSLHLFVGGPDGERSLEPSMQPPGFEGMAMDYLERRRDLGALASPDELAAALRPSLPPGSTLRIEISQLELHPESGRLRRHLNRYRYRPDGTRR